jgi:uncharacterized membrane protein
MTDRHERGTDEFGRVVTFSDGVFAIAMTLLVVGIAEPTVKAADLNEALSDLIPDILAFFISFLVIGRYWMAHHRFFARLRVVDRRLMAVNLMYLAAIAFVPFPTGLVSRYENSAITIVIYALALGAASLLEAVMLVIARKARAFREPVSSETFRFEVIASVLPVGMFAISVPIAFVSTTLALMSWILVLPGERLVARLGPPAYRALE